MKRPKKRRLNQPAKTHGLPAHFFAEKNPETSRRNEWLFCGLLFFATLLAYQRSWHAGFIWDDDAHLTANPCIVGPLGFKAIWTTSAAVYYPLVLTSFWVQHAIWGLNPLPYHLVNIVMHAAAGILLWRVLRNLNVPGAWLGAAFWTLHPVSVESAAWITELKNTQSAVFYLLAILFFLKWRARQPAGGSKNERFYALALFCAALAILSKASTVMLPVVLALCWWWLERRWQWRNLFRLVPFILISSAASYWTIWEQKFHSGATGAEWTQSNGERIAIAGKIIWFYLEKLCWPEPLIFIYPRWSVDASQATAYLPVAVALAVLFFLWWQRNVRLGPAFLASAYFVVSLFPALGFFNIYFFRYSFVGDHFQYLASMGPLALAAAGLHWIFGRWQKLPVKFICGILLLALAILTWRHSGDFHDQETLWRATLEKNPSCWMAENNLGKNLLGKNRRDEATTHFQKALALKPDYEEAHNNLGETFLQSGRITEAIEQYQRAIKIDPVYAEAHNNLGIAYFQSGRTDEAVAEFLQSVKCQPGSAANHNSLAIACLQIGRVNDSIAEARQALKISPNYLEAHNTLGAARLADGKLEAAADEYHRILEIQPGFAPAHFSLGNIFRQQGNVAAAADEYIQALKLQPDYPDALNNLGVAWLQAGQPEKAIAAYRAALKLQPSNRDTMNNLAWALALGPAEPVRAQEAIELAARANQLAGGTDPQLLRTLAAAYAKAAKYSEAMTTTQAALQLSEASNPALADALRQEIQIYQARRDEISR